jgi:ferredoxin
MTPTMSENPAASWTLAIDRNSGAYELKPVEQGVNAKLVSTEIPESEWSAMNLEEFASTGKVGLVGINEVVEGSIASKPLQQGDMLAAAWEVDRLASRVSLEGLTKAATMNRLSTLDTSKGITLIVKRLVPKYKAKVRIVYPESDNLEDDTLELYPGTKLRQAMLVSGVRLNDPLARRFDSGGDGDCGGEGCCLTCAIDVQEGMDAFNPQKIQEQAMLRDFPSWRLGCKAIIANLQADTDVTIKVMPRNFNGFYGAEECDIDGVPLARETTGRL